MPRPTSVKDLRGMAALQDIRGSDVHDFIQRLLDYLESLQGEIDELHDKYEATADHDHQVYVTMEPPRSSGGPLPEGS